MIIINIIIDYIVLFYYHSNSYRDNDTAFKANVIELICDDKSKLMRNKKKREREREREREKVYVRACVRV